MSGEQIVVLVVEDSPVVAEDLKELLEEAGCRVVGPVASAIRAWELLEGTKVDVGLLDVQVEGAPVFPLAEELRRRGTRIVFHTGHDPSWVVPPQLRDCPCLEKPVAAARLLAAVKARQTA